jgi:hypothetical protein
MRRVMRLGSRFMSVGVSKWQRVRDRSFVLLGSRSVHLQFLNLRLNSIGSGDASLRGDSRRFVRALLLTCLIALTCLFPGGLERQLAVGGGPGSWRRQIRSQLARAAEVGLLLRRGRFDPRRAGAAADGKGGGGRLKAKEPTRQAQRTPPG